MSIKLNPLTAPGFEVFLTHPMLSTAPAHPAEHVVPQDPSKRPCSWHAPSTFVPRMFNSEKRIFPCFHGFPAENLKLDPCLNGRKSTTITYVQLCLRSFSISPWVSRAFSTAKAPLPRIATFWPADLWSGAEPLLKPGRYHGPWGYNGCKVGVWNGSVTSKKTALPAFGDYMTCWRQSRLHPTIKHSE